MDIIVELFQQLGRLLRPYSADIALALIASLLVITGGDINRFIKKQVGNAHFVIRTFIFVVVCTFGYGALTVLLTNLLKVQLASLSSAAFAVVVVSGFVLLGLFAERKRQI